MKLRIPTGPGRRRAIAIGVALATVAVIAPVWVSVRSHRGPAAPPWRPAAGTFLNWPVTGNSTDDHDLVQRAIAVWTAYTAATFDGPSSLTEVRPLLVQSESPAGPVVALQAIDNRRGPRLAILTGVASAASGTSPVPLYVRADRPIPDPLHTRQVSMVTHPLGDNTRTVAGTPALAVAIGDPLTARISITPASSTSNKAIIVPGRTAVVALTATDTAFTTRLTGQTSNHSQWDAYADDNTIGEPRAHQVTYRRESGAGHISVQLPTDAAAHVTAGALVASRLGVVGKIAAIAGDAADVELISHPGFEVPVVTATGTFALARATDHGLALVSGSTPTGQLVYASQSSNTAGNTGIQLPLGITADPTGATPSSGGEAAWTADVATVRPAADVRDRTQLFVHTASVLP